MTSADLGRQLESVVEHLVGTGRYGSKSEVLREGVRVVEESEQRLILLDAAIERGIASSNAGRIHPAEEAFDRLEHKYAAQATDTA